MWRTEAQIDVGIRVVRAVGAVAIADLEVDRIGSAAIDELMAVIDPRREAGTHAGLQQLFALLGPQHHLTLEHEHELVLVRVPVTHGGFPAGRQYRVVDTDAGEAEGVPDAALESRQHPRAIGFRVTAAIECLDGAWVECRLP